MNRMVGLFTLLSLGAWLGCSGSVETSSGAGGSGSSSSSNSSTSSTTSGTGGGATCGGFGGLTCGTGEFCDYPDELCGGADGTGICVQRPSACTDEINPTCGCDGVVYDNPCAAAQAGVDISNLGMCQAPTGSFGCGPSFCKLGAEYCQRAVSDVGGFPDFYSCLALPAACGTTPSCACLAGVPCADFLCEPTSDGGLRVTCPGG